MTHDEIINKLSAFHDKELQRGEMAHIRAHLAKCAGCSLEISRLRALDGILTPHTARADRKFAIDVMERITRLRGLQTIRRPIYAEWWKVPALALTSCAAYILCVETGLLPSGPYSLASTLAAQSDASKASSVLFGGSHGGSGQMLALLLDGDKK